MPFNSNLPFGGVINPYGELYRKNHGPKADGPWWVKLLIGVILWGLLIGAFIWLVNQ